MAIFDGHLARKTRGLGIEDSAVYRQPRKQKGAILIALQAVYCGLIVNPNRMFCVLNGHRKCHLRRVGDHGLWSPPGAESVDLGKRHWREVNPF